MGVPPALAAFLIPVMTVIVVVIRSVITAMAMIAWGHDNRVNGVGRCRSNIGGVDRIRRGIGAVDDGRAKIDGHTPVHAVRMAGCDRKNQHQTG